jgi:hypothetical protein
MWGGTMVQKTGSKPAGFAVMLGTIALSYSAVTTGDQDCVKCGDKEPIGPLFSGMRFHSEWYAALFVCFLPYVVTIPHTDTALRRE